MATKTMRVPGLVPCLQTLPVAALALQSGTQLDEVPPLHGRLARGRGRQTREVPAGWAGSPAITVLRADGRTRCLLTATPASSPGTAASRSGQGGLDQGEVTP